MPGFFGFNNNDICSHTAIPYAINIANKTPLVKNSQWQEYNYQFTSVTLTNNPLSGQRLYDNDNHIGLFSGDLVGYDELPWEKFIEAINSNNTGIFETLNGAWALAIINKKKSTIYLISDRRSQHPLYYDTHDGQLRFSTELSVFCRLSSPASFNVNWLYELLFFHFPVGETTFLKNVNRMPAASILEYNLSSGNISIYPYSEPLKSNLTDTTEKETLSNALEIFSSRIPVYAPEKTPWAAAVTGGWDARTILAFSINHNPVTYTYGIPGCGDLIATKDAARKLEINHKEIFLDQKFTDQLSSLMFETVFLSDGQENCFRSSLLHVYSSLTEYGKTFPVVLSGIGLDSMFRGHLGPALVSPDMKNIFMGKSDQNQDVIWKSLVKDHSAFRSCNDEKVCSLLSHLGSPTNGATHLLYFLYEIAPKYYGGEINIARHFTTLRTPALDNDIIEFALSSKLSTLSFSNFLSSHKRGDYTEEKLQSYLLSNSPNPKFRSLPIQGVPPFAVLQSRHVYNALKFIFKVKSRLKRFKQEYKISAPLERNVEWYMSTLQEEIQNLLYSNETRITEYLNLPTLSELATVDNQHLFKKLLTAEIIIRLIENRWQKFW